MADTVRFDVSGLADLAQELKGAGARLSARVQPIIKRGAQNIKTDAQKRFSESRTGRYLPWYGRSISYDITTAHLGTTGGRVTAEIGPESGKKQGRFGPGIEFGSANHPPIPHLTPALEAEQPKTEQQLLTAAVNAVFR